MLPGNVTMAMTELPAEAMLATVVRHGPNYQSHSLSARSARGWRRTVFRSRGRAAKSFFSSQAIRPQGGRRGGGAVPGDQSRVADGRYFSRRTRTGPNSHSAGIISRNDGARPELQPRSKRSHSKRETENADDPRSSDFGSHAKGARRGHREAAELSQRTGDPIHARRPAGTTSLRRARSRCSPTETSSSAIPR